MLIEDSIADNQASGPIDPDALKELGDCHAAMGEHSRAKDCYRRACELAPQQAGPRLAMAMLALRNDELDEARRCFALAGELDPRSADVHAGLAVVHHRSHRYPQAFESYMKCLEIDGDNMVALLGLFQTSCQMGTFDKIIGYLEVYLQRHRDDASVLFCLAVLYARSGNLASARRSVLDVLRLEPQKEQAWELLRQIENRILRQPSA